MSIIINYRRPRPWKVSAMNWPKNTEAFWRKPLLCGRKWGNDRVCEKNRRCKNGTMWFWPLIRNGARGWWDLELLAPLEFSSPIPRPGLSGVWPSKYPSKTKSRSVFELLWAISLEVVVATGDFRAYLRE